MNKVALNAAKLSITRPWLTVAAWIAAAIAMTALSLTWQTAYSDDISVPGSDSAIASDLLGSVEEGGGTRLIVASPTAFGSSDSQALAELLDAVAQALDVEVANPLANPEQSIASGALTPDARGANIAIDVDVAALTEDQETAAIEALELATDQGWQAAYSGELARSLDAVPSHRSEIIGLIAAIIILTVALGSAVAMSVPVIAGVTAVAVGLASVGLLSHATSIPEIAPTLATMIGLGVGIDYALFQVARLRRALADGLDHRQAVLATAASAGASAAFAGLTVALAICALAISGVSFIGWLGYGSAIVVLIVVLSALTFTPAVLMILAPKLRSSESRAQRAGGATASLAHFVVAKPWITGGVALAVLLALAVPTAALSLGMTSPGDRAQGTQGRTSYDLRAEYFGEGSNALLTVVVALDSPAQGPQDARLLELSQSIASTSAAESTPLVPMPDDPSIATARVTPAGDMNSASTAAVLEELRSIEAPQGSELHVGGATATRIDLADKVTERLPWLMAAVVLASSLLLVIAFRSILIPIKAAIMNLLSVAASYGVVVAVFQWGWGSSLLGLDGPVAIDSFVPMILFTVLFGLSTDYEVFLVSSMREVWERTGDSKLAIVEGMRRSGRVISNAAIIMIVVFLSFVAQPDPTIKIFGLGLAVSILLDATVIRMLLVPAVMKLMGDKAWWLPRSWDARLPHLEESA